MPRTKSAAGGRRSTLRLVATLMRWRLPQPLSRSVVLNDGNRLLVAGGLTAAGSTSAILRIDPVTGAVRDAGRLAVPVHDAAGLSLGHDRLVLGGGNQSLVSAVQQLGSAGAAVVGRLPKVRADLVAAVAGSTGYVLAGYDGIQPDASVLGTSDGRHFRAVANLAVPVRYPAVVVAGPDIYLFGGESGSGVTRVIQRIDPSTGSARIVGSLPDPLAHASAFAFGRYIFVVGGVSAGVASSDIRRYDPMTGRVVVVGRLPYPVSDAGSAVFDGTAYLLGGENPGQIATVIALRPR